MTDNSPIPHRPSFNNKEYINCTFMNDSWTHYMYKVHRYDVRPQLHGNEAISLTHLRRII
jgi:hypothetical protein